jgi:membrane fusion protein, multidrug efflux system
MVDQKAYSESEHKKNRLLLYLFVSVIIVLAILVIVMLAFIFGKQNQVQKNVLQIHPPVSSIAVEKGTLQVTLTVNGFLEAENRVDIIPMVSGTLTSISVKEGQSVQKGQILATIDSQALELNLQQVENSFKFAESEYIRTKSLYDNKITSTQNFEQVENQYRAAESKYEAVRLQYQYSFVKTPISGIVIDIYTTEGSIAGTEHPLMTISNQDQLIINNQIPEIYYETFVGRMMDIQLNIRRPSIDVGLISGHIVSISHFISPQTKTFTVKCSVDRDSSILIPGMFVKTEFILEERKDIYILPFEILMGGDKLWYLGYPVDEKDKVIPGDPLYRAASIKFNPEFSNNDYFQLDEQFSDLIFLKEGQNFIYEDQIIRLKSGPGLNSENF